MINAIPAMPPQNSPYTFFLPFTNRWGFFDYADSLVRDLHGRQPFTSPSMPRHLA